LKSIFSMQYEGMTKVEVDEFIKEQKEAMKRFEVYEKDCQNSLKS